MNGASSPSPSRRNGAAADRRSSYAGTGSRFPFNRNGGSARQDAIDIVASAVLAAGVAPRRCRPHPTAGTAVFTVSPTTVYAKDACTPANTSPVFSPTRNASRRPPPDSSATSRRTTSACQPRPGRSRRVVLVGGRRAEDGHDAVAGELVDVAAHRRRPRAKCREHPVGNDADPLRIEVLRPGGEVGQVTEQHRHDPPLGRRVAHARRVEDGTAGVAERAPAAPSACRTQGTPAGPRERASSGALIACEVVQLGAHRELGGRPQRRVDVGVDPAHDGRRVARRRRRPPPRTWSSRSWRWAR